MAPLINSKPTPNRHHNLLQPVRAFARSPLVASLLVDRVDACTPLEITVLMSLPIDRCYAAVHGFSEVFFHKSALFELFVLFPTALFFLLVWSPFFFLFIDSFAQR